MNKVAVLVVDDEQSLRDFVSRNLQKRNFEVHTAANGLEALAVFNANRIDLVIMDLMMPHMDGLEAIRQIRQSSVTPIVVLSALEEEHHKVQALNLGADDYLTKPFGVSELLARVNAVLRRAQWSSSPTLTKRLARGDFVADLERHQVTVRGQPVELTPTEFELLVYFMKNTNKVLSHEIILQRIWGPEYGQEAEYLRVYIGRLRQKIEPSPSTPQHLLTERGIGYSFVI
ncbi:MAG TPA: response regulator transcription factor [Anaerolineae bacterium]|nr:response regulator transcription factor [Anaerolineae bacterium]MCB0178891.1 response regulator transcription factor [Anaerolineae bacterium]MCB0223236.1 response regulator transcription factor [Anaerolineae bacterium]MCB9108370.1 response regulator transcription factor [Anaerolineales bacterium]HRV95180.1 response regulator transcription factor [Anaerolineae bacterium]